MLEGDHRMVRAGLHGFRFAFEHLDVRVLLGLPGQLVLGDREKAVREEVQPVELLQGDLQEIGAAVWPDHLALGPGRLQTCVHNGGDRFQSPSFSSLTNPEVMIASANNRSSCPSTSIARIFGISMGSDRRPKMLRVRSSDCTRITRALP